MEFARVVGSRRSIRWFKPWKPVEPGKVQRILEAARLTGCPGNLQPWRAVVVVQADIDPADRERLLDAANRQRAHEQAPVWIYWFADPAAVAPAAFLAQISLGIDIGMLSASAGWSREAARESIEHGTPAPPGMPPLHQTVHGLPPEIAGIVAAQETVGACTVATLAAVNEGLGTCLHVATAPGSASVLFEVLGVPAHFLPGWLQLLGYPAEEPAGGGQRPREPFESLFARGRWGTPLARDPAVAEEMEREGLIQPAAPLPGRAEEIAYLSRMFGYDGGAARPEEG
jgi:nitroreductase